MTSILMEPRCFTAARCKDSSPLETVKRIREILEKLEITVMESWHNPAPNYYSVRLQIANSLIGTNGKGSSYEYALASAYAEFMERLQNQMLYRYFSDFDPELWAHGGFSYAPDEKVIPLGSINDMSAFLEPLKILGGLDNTAPSVGDSLPLASPPDLKNSIISVPYYFVNSERIVYIPQALVDVIFKSNGMCAGNSPHEALVQGFSEIIERYVNRVIIEERLSPPDIPDTFIKRRSPKCYEMINIIRKAANFNLLVKDCSLGRNLPAIGVILIEKSEKKYFVKFGAHPVFEIALERTLTELLQGKCLNKFTGLKPFKAVEERSISYINLERIFIHGSGYYPNEIFSSKNSYSFSANNFMRDFASNKEMFHWFLDLLVDKMKTNVLIRDVSFLGFSAFHVMVPEVSKITGHEIKKTLENEILRIETKRIVKNLPNASDLELRKVIDFLNRNSFINKDSIAKLAVLPFLNSFPWHDIRTDLFLSAAYYRLGDMKKSVECISRFIEEIGPEIELPLLNYYKVFRDVIIFRSKNIPESEILEHMGIFYGTGLLNEVLVDTRNPRDIFKYYGILNCWGCEKCAFVTHCSYAGVRNIHKKLKDAYSRKTPDQNAVKEIIIK